METQDNSKERVLSELLGLRSRVAELEKENKLLKETLHKREHDIGERVKELNCLYNIAKIVEKPNITLEEILQATAGLLRPAWQYPEITCARIIWKEQEFKTDNFRETVFRQASDIILQDNRVGAVEVFYLEGRPEVDEGPFLREERNLIDAIAERLGRVIERKITEEAGRESEKKFRDIAELSPQVIYEMDSSGRVAFANKETFRILGITEEEYRAGIDILSLFPPDEHPRVRHNLQKIIEQGVPHGNEYTMIRKDGSRVPVIAFSAPIFKDGKHAGFRGVLIDITERKRVEEMIQRRIVALTQPVEGGEIVFEDLFNIDEIQRIQDDFAMATGVASLITRPDGTPLTALSNFTYLCSEFVRKTEKGRLKCAESDAVIGRCHPEGPIVQTCLSAGLWNAGASIMVGGRHIANWLVGQVRDETQTEESMRAYARELGVDEASFIKAFQEVPVMPREKFEQIAKALFTLANQLSTTAYQNVQQARFIADRKQAEEALRQAEEKYRSIFENALEGIFQTTPEGRFLSANPALARMYGFESPQELMATVTNLENQMYVDPADREKLKKLYEEQSFVTDFHTRLYRKDGSVLWISMNARAVRDADGRIICYEGTAEDITERKRAEEAFRKSEEQYRRIVETTGEGICVVDKNFNITFVNKRYVEMLGYSAEEIVGAKLFSFMFEEDVPDVLKRREKRRLGTSEHFERRFCRKDGSTLWVHASVTPMMNEERRFFGSFAMYTDITQRKEAEEALRRSEEKYRGIFENAIMGIFQTTPDGRYLSVNPTGAKIYGYESPQEMMQIVTDVAHQIYVYPGDRERFKELINTHGFVEGFESEHYCKDRSKIWTSMNARAVKDEAGTILYYETTSENITSRKRSEEEKEKLQSQLRQSQKMEAIGTLAGGIAHDFNNILTVMSGYGALLQMQMDKANPLRIYVDQILSASQKAASLTQSLLAFSRQQPITLNPVSLNDVVRGTEKLLKRLLTEDITLKTLLTPDSLAVMADPTQIDQILFNLATNARDAMPNGGTLFIETELVELDRDFTQIHEFIKPGRYICLSISDTGMGMDEKTKEHIFDPFFTTKEVGKGTGLGLSTVYGAVKQHNGYITVYSEQQKGTTFHIYLPVIRSTFVEEKPSSAHIQGGKESILVAEDNEEVRVLMRTILTEYGYTVIEAIDGKDAIDRFNRHKNIDLLIIDLVMPKKNGKEVYDEIHKVDPHIKALFTSGYTKDIVLDKGIEAKGFDFIAKPLSPNELLRKVREVLDR